MLFNPWTIAKGQVLIYTNDARPLDESADLEMKSYNLNLLLILLAGNSTAWASLPEIDTDGSNARPSSSRVLSLRYDYEQLKSSVSNPLGIPKEPFTLDKIKEELLNRQILLPTFSGPTLFDSFVDEDVSDQIGGHHAIACIGFMNSDHLPWSEIVSDMPLHRPG